MQFSIDLFDRFVALMVRSRRGFAVGVVSVKKSVRLAVAVVCDVLLATFARYGCRHQHGTSCLPADRHFPAYSATHIKCVVAYVIGSRGCYASSDPYCQST